MPTQRPDGHTQKYVHPLQAHHKEGKAAASKRGKYIQKQAKHGFLQSQDVGDMIAELQELDDMEFNPNFGAKAVEHHHNDDWIKPGMHSERLASTAIKRKRERLHDRFDQMIKMYTEMNMLSAVENIKKERIKYESTRKRKNMFSDAITKAKEISLDDIMMPGETIEMELSRKSQNIDEVGAYNSILVNNTKETAGGDREAIIAATRAKNRLRGPPGPPTLTLPRSFKHFKSNKSNPPPPPKLKKSSSGIDRGGPNYTKSGPIIENLYEYKDLNLTIEDQMKGNFRPSGRKRAPPPPPKKDGSGANTLSNKKETSITKTAKPKVKYNTKSITNDKVTHFMPRHLKGVVQGKNDTVTLQRNVALPKVKPDVTGDKSLDEYNKFLYEVDSLPTKKPKTSI